MVRVSKCLSVILVASSLWGCGSSDTSSSAAGTGEGAAGALPQNQYPADLIGRYSDRSCEESQMIEETVDMWPGFEITEVKKTEQALTCAPMEVSAVDGGYGITEQCTVMGAPDVVLRRVTYRKSETGMGVTLDGKDKPYGRC